jgi:repressor LexA
MALASKLGIAKSTISMYENGKREPDYETLELIADFFNVNIGSLLTGKTALKSKSATGTCIPVLGYVRAGIPVEAVEDILDYEEISSDLASTGEFFALKIKGDSMEPKISEGDVVIVRKQEQVENGELAVVLVNGNDATVKRFYMNESGVTLISSNPSYPPFIYSKEQVAELPVSVIGKVIELRAKF